MKDSRRDIIQRPPYPRAILAAALALTLAMPLASCITIQDFIEGTGNFSPDSRGSYESQADRHFESLVAAIEARDKEAVRALFSKTALAEAEDIDAGIDYLFSLVQGSRVSWERGATVVYGSNDPGVVNYDRVDAVYSLVTSEDTYIFSIKDYVHNVRDRENRGIWCIRAASYNDRFTQIYNYDSDNEENQPDLVGIFVPKDNGEGEVADALFEKLFATLQARDGEALADLFSIEARQEAWDMSGGIEYTFELVQGDLLSWERRTYGTDVDAWHNNLKSVHSWYTIVTTEDTYTVFMMYYEKNLGQPLNQYLHAVRVIRASEEKDADSQWQAVSGPGVYRPYFYGSNGEAGSGEAGNAESNN